MKQFSFLALVVWSFTSPTFSQSWVQKQSLPSPNLGRNHPVTFALEDKGYLLTGGNYAVSNYFNDFHSYDPSTDTWTQLADFPGGARSFAVGLAAAGKGYIGFGDNVAGEFLNDLWEYSPQTGEWKQLASCPCLGRAHPAFVEVGGKIYVGMGNNASNLKDFWAYDIATDTWEQKADLPAQERHHPFYFSLGDYAYVGFGHGNAMVAGWVVYNDFYRYDPANDTWTALENFPGEARVAGTQFSYNGKGYVLHGEGQDHFYLDEGELWEYDPVTETWTQLPSMPGGGRWAPGTFVIGDVAYSVCGTVIIPDFEEKSDLWAYNFPVISTVKDEVGEDEELVVSPNPVSNILNIKLRDESLQTSRMPKIEVFSSNGQLLFHTANSWEDGIDVSHLATGLYWIRANDGLNSFSAKFVKD
jgi:N-acetylneuraminic acid mutarotase